MYPAVNAIQNFNWDPRFNEEYLNELGNALHAAQMVTPEVSGSFEMTATGASVAMLRRMIGKQTAGEYAGYLAGSPGAANHNTGTIREKDLENAIFDVIEAKAPNQTFSRSTLLPRMHLSQMSMRADANGTVSETYNFEGDLVRIFPTGKHDVVTVPATRTGADEAAKSTNIQITEAAYQDVATDNSADYQIAFVMIDEVIVPVGAITVGVAGKLTLAAPYTVGAGQRISVVLYKTVPGTMPTIEYPTAARFIKANQADIFLVPRSTVDIRSLADGALMAYNFLQSDRVLRAQSMDLSVDLRREALRQIAKNDQASGIFYRAATYPLNITSSISVLETSMGDHAKLQGKNEATDILDLESFEGNEWQIVLRVYHNGTALQTTAFTDARVSGRGSRVQAAGRAEISWSFTGSGIVIEGI
jgi:hypothetical protein